jgi:glycosyltransferase involved in cell wall biosynthesis
MTTVAVGARRRRLALVLWNGDVGGAEVVTAALAAQMRSVAVDATVVFIGEPAPLAERLEHDRIPCRSLGFGRGRGVLGHPRRYARQVAEVGADGALLVECGFMGAALRAGGYAAPIVALEHGAVLELGDYGRLRRLAMRAARAGGAWADDAEVAVSDFVLERMRAVAHAADLRRIHNGIDLTRFTSEDGAGSPAGDGACRLGFAGRLIPGKGADHLIEAIVRARRTAHVTARIAGEGPERASLETLARTLLVEDRVEFCGLVHDMPGFWRSVDVAVVPSAEFTEACPVTPLEAMACARPVIATRNGGLPELVLDGETGLLVERADTEGLADAFARYAEDPRLARMHGERARARVREHFNIVRCAQAYLDLFSALAASRARRAR